MTYDVSDLVERLRGLDLAIAAEVTEALADLVTLRARERSRERDAAYPEFVPEVVLDAAFASQADWWRPGNDAHAPVVQIAPTPEGGSQVVRTVVIATLIESVAEATYRATRAESSGVAS